MALSSHQRSVGKSQVYLTPPWILERLGKFDLDPCAADPRPWDCATVNYTEADDGLSKPWAGRVWLNPPFDSRVIGDWLRRLAEHGSGTALVHARTETKWFRHIWHKASAVLFCSVRFAFYKTDGTRHPYNSGAPLIIAAFGGYDADKLSVARLPGYLVSAPFIDTAGMDRAERDVA